MIQLDKKIIVITGGSGLLGKEFVTQCTTAKAIVISADVNCETSLDNGQIHLDVTDPDSIEKGITEIVKRYGRIDGWVNNAYPRTEDWGKKFEDISYESWQKNVDWQMNSYFKCTQSVLKQMARQKSGSVVNISSIYGIVGPDFSVYAGTEMTMPAAYSAIKAGIINLTRYLASYYGKMGIRVNCISPGGVFNNQSKEFVAAYESKVPLCRMAQPEDIAPALVFLLSDQASYISGHNLVVDGGWTAI